MKGVQFTAEEKQLLIESLLFTACADVCSDHTDVQRVKIIELAEKLNKDVGKLYNIYLYKDPIAKEPSTSIIEEKFTNIPAREIITD